MSQLCCISEVNPHAVVVYKKALFLHKSLKISFSLLTSMASFKTSQYAVPVCHFLSPMYLSSPLLSPAELVFFILYKLL